MFTHRYTRTAYTRSRTNTFSRTYNTQQETAMERERIGRKTGTKEEGAAHNKTTQRHRACGGGNLKIETACAREREQEQERAKVSERTSTCEKEKMRERMRA